MTLAAPERASRKAAIRAELQARGESKVDYVASVLGVSRSYAARCLSVRYRDEFNATHLAKLGVAGGAAERVAA